LKAKNSSWLRCKFFYSFNFKCKYLAKHVDIVFGISSTHFYSNLVPESMVTYNNTKKIQSFFLFAIEMAILNDFWWKKALGLQVLTSHKLQGIWVQSEEIDMEFWDNCKLFFKSLNCLNLKLLHFTFKLKKFYY